MEKESKMFWRHWHTLLTVKSNITNNKSISKQWLTANNRSNRKMEEENIYYKCIYCYKSINVLQSSATQNNSGKRRFKVCQ